MSCGVYHIKTTAGDIYAQTFTWNSEDGEPIDLSIYTDIKMQIKQTLFQNQQYNQFQPKQNL